MARNKLLRMDNVGIVVKSSMMLFFFHGDGLKLERRAIVEEEWVSCYRTGHQSVEMQ